MRFNLSPSYQIGRPTQFILKVGFNGNHIVLQATRYENKNYLAIFNLNKIR